MAVNGWMGSFNTAALDPIFWLHHANIDRLWTVWRRRKAGHLDPTEAGWLTNLSFEFHDATGQEVSFTSSQVVDTTVPLLSYRYEDEGDPLGAGLEVIVERTRQMDQLPEMVGATDKPVVLKGRAETVELAVSQPTGPALAALESGGPPPPMYLNLENVTGAGRATSYGVYLNLPPGSDPKNHEDLLAGVVPMFGVKEASREDQGHPGSGLHYALEISPVVRRLEAKNAWNPGEIRITFVPRHLRGDGLEAAGDPIQVGRVSLYLG
jgi:tyrosinase